MGSSSGSGSRSPSLILPGSILALLALMGLMIDVSPLDSTRPEASKSKLPLPPSPTGMTSTYSRLWEDPLEAAYSEETEKACSPTASCEAEAELSPADRMRQLFVESTKASWSLESKYRGEVLHLLIVLLPGEPHAEASETRKRIRYAVTTGLGVANYHLTYPDRMTYVDVEMAVYIKALNTLAKREKIRVPIKLYATKNDGKAKRLLVMWVNENGLGNKPLDAVSEMLGRLFFLKQPASSICPIPEKTVVRNRSDSNQNGDEILRILQTVTQNALSTVSEWCTSQCVAMYTRVSILGPTSSDTFQTMASEEESHGDGRLLWPQETMTVYNYRATISPRPEVKGNNNFIHMIGTDEELVDALDKELGFRHAKPTDAKQHMVLLTERDTSYGRGLRDLFRKRYEEFEKNIHMITYLRGIDGGPRKPVDDKNRSGLPSDPLMYDLETEMPEGTSQYDYIRRVALQVVQLQDRLLRSNGGKVTSVGVLGTDVYDKLLVLRALRPRLPNAVYFTTDLDASLSHAREYATTRNLIVASHFNRMLHPNLQREAPVFRDSYQTSCFLSTLLLADDSRVGYLLKREKGTPASDLWKSNLRDQLYPLVFEIARTGPFQLTRTGGNEYIIADDEKFAELVKDSLLNPLIQPPNNYDVSGKRLLPQLFGWSVCLLLLAVCVGAYIPATRVISKEWQVRIGIATLAILFVVIVLFSIHQKSGEPFAIASGISVWPTIALRLLATVFAIYYIVKSIKGVHKTNAEEIDRKFNLPQPLFARKQPADNRWLKKKIVGFREAFPDKIFIADKNDVPVDRVWRRYLNSLATPYILFRVIPLSTVFCAFVVVLTWLGERPNHPARGTLAHWLEWVSLMLALATFFALTLTVIDLVQCARYVAKSFRKYDSEWVNPYFTMTELDKSKPPRLLAHRAKIQLLADLTRTTSSLIVDPSKVLVILIFSQLTIFDYWVVPWTLLVPIFFCGIAALYANYSLRQEVEKVREKTLRLVRRDRFDALGDPSATRTTVDQHDQAIKDIESDQRGAFRPLSEDPLLKAIAIPFGGFGSALLLEQFFRGIG
jgi:hypothetical protein